MRPLELRLKGFRSYREEAVFDWRGRHLVGVVGPIGAGKSSILEAIAFALYGKTPTFERDTKSLINQTASECHVELRFEVDGQVWRAARGLRRKGASGHQLQRLDADRTEAVVLEPIAGEKPVRERVERLLGMDFAAFCRSVLLAQNRFADFLKATPRERNEVLKGVFGYERFDGALEAAKRRVTAAQLLLESLDREGSQLASARAQLEVAEQRLETAATRAAALEAVREPYERAAASTREAATRASEAEVAQARLVEAAASLPTSEEIDEVTEAAGESAAAIEQAEAAVDAAEAARADAEAAHAAVAERVGDQMAFASLVTEHEHLVAAAERAALAREQAVTAAREAAAAVEQLGAVHERAIATLEDADRSLEEAAEKVADAERALHAARHADMARTLRAELVAGQPCPVCERAVATIPKAGRAPAIAGAEQALDRARRGETQAQAAHRSAANDATAADERLGSGRDRAEERARDLERAEEALRAADAALSAVQSELVDRLGEGDPRALLEERTRELADASAAMERTNAAAADARAALDRARRVGENGRDRLSTLANRIVSVWGMLGQARGVATDTTAVRSAFVEAGEALLEGHEHARTALAAAQQESQAATGTMRALLEGVGLEPDDDLTMALATASAEHGAADEQVRSLRATIDAGADLDGRITAARTDHALASRLVADLQPSRFLAFLLEEERRALAELGSVHFEELTGNAYRFTDDDRFEVLDMNAAGTERRADSLSGGETFLASLALALALAEMVARGGGRLDAFFLDEGFGSLDPEHLDRAMDGIGRLVANDPRRLVVLVSHVEQMRQTLEDLIVLDKHDLTGDTVVVAGATLV
ncbi:MAG TPA: SMC family ATPase [Actinomycetota bacterium]|nr:SMC family ATPase [Actinomycetota bacterium]